MFALVVCSAAFAPTLHGIALARPSCAVRSPALIVASESLAVTNVKAVVGIVSAPVTWASLYTLATTGCGLSGLSGVTLGALEGLAYAVTIGYYKA